MAEKGRESGCTYGSFPVDRRTALTATAFAAAIAVTPAEATVVADGSATLTLGRRQIRVVDLTHALTSAFNWMPTRPRIAMDPIIGSGLAVGMNLNRLMLVEHTGTHIDVPRHFANDGKSLGEVPISDLVVPLAILNIADEAKSNPDMGVEPSHIIAWERKHGALPKGCCVAIDSGYDPLARMSGTVTGIKAGSPGFSPQACDFLIKERDVKGIAVDAMSIDQGHNGPAYPVHQHWLRSGRWGIEGLTNMGQVPPRGALLFVGAPPIMDTTGMPIRAIAMFES